MTPRSRALRARTLCARTLRARAGCVRALSAALAPFAAALALAVATPAAAQIGTFDDLNAGSTTGGGAPPPVPAAPPSTPGAAPPAAPQASPPAVTVAPPPPPPPPPPPTETTWFVLVNGAQTGPFTAAEIEEKVRKGQMDGATLVWAPGMDQWVAAAAVAALAPLVAAELTPIPGDRPTPPAAPDAGPVAPPPPDAPAQPAFSPAEFILGTWGTGGQGVDLGGGLIGDMVLLASFQRDEAFLRIAIEANVEGQFLRLDGDGGGVYELQSLDDRRFRVTPYWIVSYTAQGQPVDVEVITEPYTFRVVDRNTLLDELTGTTFVRQ